MITPSEITQVTIEIIASASLVGLFVGLILAIFAKGQ